MDKDSITITTVALNSIKLDELFQIDRSGGSTNIDEIRRSGEVDDKLSGLNVPLIMINAYSITNYLTKFHLDMSGFMPVVRFSFIAAESVFISVNYPKDGDIASIYLRAPGDYYKPIRMDFTILSVDSSVTSSYDPSGSDPMGKGVNMRFTIVGECRIPGLYSQRIKSFRNMSSYEALLEVSQDLNLGFCSNDKSLNDTMTWICPNYSYYNFIQDVSIRAYKDDHSSFFDCWIDPYYNLNFVNLGSQFAYQDNPNWEAYIIPGYVSGGVKVDSALPAVPTPESESVPLILNNYIGIGQVPFFINGYTLTSRSGNNTNQMGYITNISFYDENAKQSQPVNKYIKYDIESITTDNIKEGTMLQKGRPRDNEYRQETRREWLGVLNSKISESDGVHNNFLHAKYQNLINMNDATKMTLEVELLDYFPGIYRGQVLPVQIYVTDGNSTRQQNVGKTPNSEANTAMTPTLDYFLSGNYVVMGMYISWSYSSGGIRQYLTLAKRQWEANSSGSLPKAFPISLFKEDF